MSSERPSSSVSISAAAMLLGGSALLSRLLGVIRERLLVGHFGVGDTLDTYYASFQVPDFIFNLLVVGTLTVALIPVFLEYYDRGKREEAWYIASTVLNAAVVVMGAFAIAVWIFAPWLVKLVAPGFSLLKQHETAMLARIIVLNPFFFAISFATGSVTNALRRYTSIALAPIIYNLAIILGIITLAPRFGIAGVAWGVVVGALLHAITNVLVARQVGFQYQAILDLRHPGVRAFWKLFFPRIWGIDISQLAVLVGSIIGSTLVAGSVALYNLTINIAVVPVSVFAFSYAIAIFPVLAGAAARKDTETFVTEFSRTARQILFFTVPVGVMMIVLRAHIIRLAFGTQNLSWDNTRLAAASLALVVATLFLQGLTPLLARAYYAMKNTVIPVLVSGIALATNIAAVYAALWVLRHAPVATWVVRGLLRLHGVEHIEMLALPVAYSLAVAVQVIILIILYRCKFGRLDGYHIANSFWKIAVASIISGIFTFGGLYAAEGFGQSRTFIGLLLQTAVAGTLGVGSYLVVALYLRSEEARVFISSLKSKLWRKLSPSASQDVETLS